MLSQFLAELFPYQIFRSVFFRGAMGCLTSYFLIVFLMPFFINFLQKKRIISDFSKKNTGAPIMGGAMIIIAILISVILWVWMNVYIFACFGFLVSFGLIGLVDDYLKTRNYKKILEGKMKKKSYSGKTDGLNGSLKLGLEILFSALILGICIYYYQIPITNLQIPMVPISNWHPKMGVLFYFLFAIFVMVGCANAVNLMDGLDTLVTIPIINSFIFIAAVSYISGDMEWSQRLKILFISDLTKELSILGIIAVGSCIAFLKFNTPPAYIYMGDVGSLSLGALIGALFLFSKAELFLPIVGGVFVIAASSVIVQRIWFFVALKLRGREYAEKNRFFFRAPYHHHQQAAMDPENIGIRSIYANWLIKINFIPSMNIEKNFTKKEINSKVIWQNHIRSIWFVVIAFLIYFKVR